MIAAPRIGASTRNRSGRAALIFCAISFLYFGLRPLLQSGRQYVGHLADPQLFIWSFAWFAHATVHGQNPLVSRAIWAPVGVNLTWATSLPGLAALFMPLTLLFGAVASYNAAAVLLPAAAAWTAFLLFRHLTRSFWPALAGGYLFGFSSYMFGQQEGHVQMTAVFLVPLVALVVLRYVEGELTSRRLVVRLGPLLALQLLFSTELVPHAHPRARRGLRPGSGTHPEPPRAAPVGARAAHRLVRRRGRAHLSVPLLTSQPACTPAPTSRLRSTTQICSTSSTPT